MPDDPAERVRNASLGSVAIVKEDGPGAFLALGAGEGLGAGLPPGVCPNATIGREETSTART